MVSRIFTPLRNFNMNQFDESIDEANTNIYFFIGKTTAWDNDAAPDTPTESFESHFQNFADLIALKKLSASSFKPVVRRYNWVTGTIYSEYDSSDTNLFAKEFYVMNSNYDVYKCLYNNKGVPSTVEPTGTGTSNITTGDGYVWKYLYTIQPSDVANFLAANWMPVYYDSDVRTAAVNGRIETINVVNGGTGYSTASVVITSDTGSGATATANLSGGAVVSITVTSPGSGYADVSVSITGNGTGATARANVAPYKGHGYDPEKELGCSHLMVLTSIIGEEFPVSISYRKVGVLLNPYEPGGTVLASDAEYLDPQTELDFGSGTFWYIENRIPITRTSDSTEEFKFVVRF